MLKGWRMVVQLVSKKAVQRVVKWVVCLDLNLVDWWVGRRVELWAR